MNLILDAQLNLQSSSTTLNLHLEYQASLKLNFKIPLILKQLLEL